MARRRRGRGGGEGAGRGGEGGAEGVAYRGGRGRDAAGRPPRRTPPGADRQARTGRPGARARGTASALPRARTGGGERTRLTTPPPSPCRGRSVGVATAGVRGSRPARPAGGALPDGTPASVLPTLPGHPRRRADLPDRPLRIFPATRLRSGSPDELRATRGPRYPEAGFPGFALLFAVEEFPRRTVEVRFPGDEERREGPRRRRAPGADRLRGPGGGGGGRSPRRRSRTGPWRRRRLPGRGGRRWPGRRRRRRGGSPRCCRRKPRTGSGG